MEAGALQPMVVASFGTSTPFAYWGFVLLCKVVGFLTGDFARIHGTTLNELREGWRARAGRSVVFTTDLPETALTAFFSANRVRTVVFLDDPKDAVISAIASRGLTVEEAIRFSTRGFCAMAEPFTDPAALVIRRWKVSDIRDILGSISTYLGGEGDDKEIEALLSFCVDTYSPDKSSNLEYHLSESGIHGAIFGNEQPEISHFMDRLIDKAIDGYRPLLQGDQPSNICWPNELFFGADNRAAFAPIDITGRARTIIWGPYMFLPRGTWKATVVFEVANNLSGDLVVTDVRVNEVLVEKRAMMPKFGMFSYYLIFDIDDPNKPVEVRLLMTRGAIEGTFL